MTRGLTTILTVPTSAYKTGDFRNSGVWLRWMGPRTEYQADFLDQPSHPGVSSGSLYCMGKGFIAENRDASTVNQVGWNRLRVRAQGEHIAVMQSGSQNRLPKLATTSSEAVGVPFRAGWAGGVGRGNPAAAAAWKLASPE